jgi:hypothetical protein
MTRSNEPQFAEDGFEVFNLNENVESEAESESEE